MSHSNSRSELSSNNNSADLKYLMKKIAFIIPPTVELLDLAGPVQVFTEAKFQGLDIDIEFYLYEKNPVSTCGLVFGKIPNFKEARLDEGDFVFIPGMDQGYLQSSSFKSKKAFFKWLKDCNENKINICSVCNGAFALGEAGLLDDRECTTHWRRVEELQRRYPKAKVLNNVLYVKKSLLCTSAGISAGIDLALSILEEMAGSYFTHKVARGLVFYHRGNGQRTQPSHYLNFRNHINMKIHEVQDYIVHNIDNDNPIGVLAAVAGMSARNLTRLFRQTTGITINQYVTNLRIETAKGLLKDPQNPLAYIASRCGFKSVRQLQRILK
jgi:transcriptional regulator GlxA family with amidase domain